MSREIPFSNERKLFAITLASASTRSMCALPLAISPVRHHACL